MVDVSIGGKYLSKIYCEDHENSEEHDSCGPTIDHDRYIYHYCSIRWIVKILKN